MLVVRHLLPIMFTQRFNCIDRLQVEKCASLFFKHKMCRWWCESVYGYQSILLLLDNYFSSSFIGKLQPKNTHTSLNIMADLNHCTAKTLCLVILSMNDVIKYSCIWPLAWRYNYKPYNSLTSLQQFLTFSFYQSKRKRNNEGKKTHYDTMDKF